MSKENKCARELKFNSKCGVWLDKSTAMEVEIFFPEHSHYNDSDFNEHFIEYSAYLALEQRLAEAEKQLAIAVEALSFYAERPCNPDILKIAPRFRNPAKDALKQIEEMKK